MDCRRKCRLYNRPPWIPVNPNHRSINAAAALADPHCVFRYDQELIGLRKTYEVFCSGSFTLLWPEDGRIFAYTRDTQTEHLLMVCHFTGETISLDAPENFRGTRMLLSNYSTPAAELRPYEAVMLYYNETEETGN